MGILISHGGVAQDGYLGEPVVVRHLINGLRIHIAENIVDASTTRNLTRGLQQNQ